jgi:hypothetical protein
LTFVKEAAMLRSFVPALAGRGSWIAGGVMAALLMVGALSAQTPPTTRTFAPDAGLVLNFIKPDKTADFEAVMAKVKEGLTKSTKPERNAQAKSWKVFKSPDKAGENMLYVFVIDPAVKDADYQVSNILAESFPPAEVNELYKKFGDSYGTGLQPVNLALVNDFSK